MRTPKSVERRIVALKSVSDHRNLTTSSSRKPFLKEKRWDVFCYVIFRCLTQENFVGVVSSLFTSLLIPEVKKGARAFYIMSVFIVLWYLLKKRLLDVFHCALVWLFNRRNTYRTSCFFFRFFIFMFFCFCFFFLCWWPVALLVFQNVTFEGNCLLPSK